MLSYYTYLIATLFASVLTALLAVNLRPFKGEHPEFSWLLASMSVWTLGAALQVLSAILDLGLGAQVFWSKAQYLGIATAPVVSFLFICRYTDTLKIRPLPLLLLPGLTLLAVWTNDYHGLIWQTLALDTRGTFAVLETEHGLWFNWVHTPYSYLLALLSFVLLVRAFTTMQRHMHAQLLILLTALVVPFVSSIIFVLGGVGSLDPTPTALAVTGLLLTLALYRFELFRQKPVAYRTVFSDLQEAILVLDDNYNIVDANPAALHLLECPLKALLGKHAEQFLTLPKGVWSDVQTKGTRVEEPMNNGYVDLYLQPIEATGGYILTIRDVTKRQQAEAKLATQLDKLNALVMTGNTLRKLHSPQTVYHKAFEVVFAKTRADTCQILLLKEGKLKAVASSRKGATEDTSENLDLNADFSWRVAESKGAVRLRNPRGLGADAASATRGGPVDYLGVPIYNEAGRVAGVLAATLSNVDESFDDSDKSFLEAVAQACGGALSRFTRLSKAQATAKEYRELYTSAQRQARELALLNRVRNAVTRQVNLDEVIHATVEAVNDEFDNTLVSLYLVKRDKVKGDRLVLQHQRGYPSLPESIAANTGVIGRVVHTGQAILLSEPSSYPGFISTAEDVSSEVAVPIFDHGKVVGVLNLETTHGFKLSQADLKLMMSLSEQISIAVGRARLYEEVHASEQRFRLLAENMSDLICLHDLEGNFTYISPSSEIVLGYAPEALLAEAPQDHVHPEDLNDVFPSVLSALAKGEPVKAFSYRVRHASGEYIWLETFVQQVTDETGQTTHFVSGSRDITERKKMQEQLLEGALLYDALTELPNRVLFADRLNQAIRRSEREAAPFALLFLDLDRFKIVNDSLGHSVGDNLLVETAKRLQGCVRAQDTVARLGGDEFAIILEGIGEGRAQEVAQCIQDALGQPYTLDGHSVSTSASIGITLGSDFAGASDPEQLLRNADLAMYHAKASGKARHAMFDSTMHHRIQDLMQLELDLRRAVEQGEFHVAYQPVVDLTTRSFTGFEALVRWNHPERGPIEPSRFIPVAEEMGLVASIDNWVLKEASRQVSEWDKRFGLDKPLTLSVNLSTKNFLLEDLVDSIKDALDASGLSASQLKLEITESVLMDNVDVGTSLLQELRDHGIGMQIDDFGTGYSSLSYLHALPLDSLKIDRSFVQQLVTAQDGAIVKTIIALAQSLGLDIVAEGIETPGQFELLTRLGCTYGQGYYMAKPLSSPEIEALFAEGGTLPRDPSPDVRTVDVTPLGASNAGAAAPKMTSAQ